MSSFYSQRGAPPPSELRYDMPEVIRDRVLAILDHHIGDQRTMTMFLRELAFWSKYAPRSIRTWGCPPR